MRSSKGKEKDTQEGHDQARPLSDTTGLPEPARERMVFSLFRDVKTAGRLMCTSRSWLGASTVPLREALKSEFGITSNCLQEKEYTATEQLRIYTVLKRFRYLSQFDSIQLPDNLPRQFLDICANREINIFDTTQDQSFLIACILANNTTIIDNIAVGYLIGLGDRFSNAAILSGSAQMLRFAFETLSRRGVTITDSELFMFGICGTPAMLNVVIEYNPIWATHWSAGTVFGTQTTIIKREAMRTQNYELAKAIIQCCPSVIVNREDYRAAVEANDLEFVKLIEQKSAEQGQRLYPQNHDMYRALALDKVLNVAMIEHFLAHDAELDDDSIIEGIKFIFPSTLDLNLLTAKSLGRFINDKTKLDRLLTFGHFFSRPSILTYLATEHPDLYIKLQEQLNKPEYPVVEYIFTEHAYHQAMAKNDLNEANRLIEKLNPAFIDHGFISQLLNYIYYYWGKYSPQQIITPALVAKVEQMPRQATSIMGNPEDWVNLSRDKPEFIAVLQSKFEFSTGIQEAIAEVERASSPRLG